MNDFLVSRHIIEDKEKWWGHGEWVSEPDHVEFVYKDHLCKIIRIHFLEGHNRDHMFGGYLCGYVQVSNELNLVEKGCDLDFDVHEGITYNEKGDDDRNWIGFDCAHSLDYMPCRKNIYSEIIHRIFPITEQMKKHSIFNPTYKNIDFCIAECKSLVDQIIEYSKSDSSQQNK